MFTTSIYGEKLVKEFTYKNIHFEVISCPSTIWCGTIGYAANCEDEPDIGALLQKYQKLCDIPKIECANPEWSCAISINYWQEGNAPRGMMFAQQVLNERQDSNHDVYTMPESLFVKVANTAEVAKAAFDKEFCELYELFGVIKDSLNENGYVVGTNGAQEIEMYNHGAGLSYAYVQVECKELFGQINNMKKFSEIKAFEDEFDVFYLPKARIIGKEVRNGGSIGNTAPSLWKEVFESGASDVLMALPHILNDSLYGWTCEYDAETDTFIYIVCALTIADTPVPDGFVYRDIPETICAKGLYGEGMSRTIERINEYGYTTNWEPYGWNAELYIQAEEENPPKQTDTPWHWIVPIRKKEI